LRLKRTNKEKIKKEFVAEKGEQDRLGRKERRKVAKGTRPKLKKNKEKGNTATGAGGFETLLQAMDRTRPY